MLEKKGTRDEDWVGGLYAIVRIAARYDDEGVKGKITVLVQYEGADWKMVFDSLPVEADDANLRKGLTQLGKALGGKRSIRPKTVTQVITFIRKSVMGLQDFPKRRKT